VHVREGYLHITATNPRRDTGHTLQHGLSRLYIRFAMAPWLHARQTDTCLLATWPNIRNQTWSDSRLSRLRVSASTAAQGFGGVRTNRG
jgi:hypothetical protein